MHNIKYGEIYSFDDTDMRRPLMLHRIIHTLCLTFNCDRCWTAIDGLRTVPLALLLGRLVICTVIVVLINVHLPRSRLVHGRRRSWYRGRRGAVFLLWWRRVSGRLVGDGLHRRKRRWVMCSL